MCVRRVRPILVLAVLFCSLTFGFFRVELRRQEAKPYIVGPHVGVQIIGKRQAKALFVGHTHTRIISQQAASGGEMRHVNWTQELREKQEGSETLS